MRTAPFAPHSAFPPLSLFTQPTTSLPMIGLSFHSSARALFSVFLPSLSSPDRSRRSSESIIEHDLLIVPSNIGATDPSTTPMTPSNPRHVGQDAS